MVIDELLEAILISTYQLPSNSRTIHQISSLQRFQQTNTTPSTTIPSSLNKTSLSSINNNNNKFNICVTVVRDRFPLDPQWNKFYSDQWYMSYKHLLPITLPGHHITIGPVLRITNLLPCDMIFFIFETDINGTLGSKEEACVHNIYDDEECHSIDHERYNTSLNSTGLINNQKILTSDSKISMESAIELQRLLLASG
ncbi:unnamed protein product [Schistosoma rodhaini]|uniref:Vacuolar protein sorting-associated protein 13 VPS13 adaptor binding domain-containing protein n=1 Tax=Schistosoma rodhaini TaxID=6188 RepID=A0AA85G3R8_9TREM|nr:unnamed protein product [Schistosoma rodhaini]CAH8605859.1 unnamed protein product [Schistosoma rodhaini]